MAPAEIEKQLKQRPFIPVRMHLSNGSSYQIRHPEMAIVTRTLVAGALPGRDAKTLPETLVWCAPGHVTHVEPIGQARSNGKTSRRGRRG